MPAAEQRLIYKGRALQDGDLLNGVRRHRSMYHTLTEGATATAASASTTTAVSREWSISGRAPRHAAALGPASLQRRLMSDPELTARILDSPFTRSLLDDPNLLRQMVNANPQLRRAMDANPQLRHALQDPNLLREAVEVARNPARAREAMRHQDLALSQLENHPEGFNALRRMYSEVQEPLMEGFEGMAVSSGGATAPSAPADPDAPLPNPWAPATTTGAFRFAAARADALRPAAHGPTWAAVRAAAGAARLFDMFDVARGGVAPPRPTPRAAAARSVRAHLDGDGGAGDDDDDITGATCEY